MNNAGVRYLLGDNLGFTNVTVSASAPLTGILDATCHSSGVTSTARRYIGQREETNAGL